MDFPRYFVTSGGAGGVSPLQSCLVPWRQPGRFITVLVFILIILIA